jgi:hypothetical protein
LNPEQREQLQRGLTLALRKQASASAASPRIAAASTFAIEDRAIRFEYRTEIRRTLSEALAAAPPHGEQPWPEERLLQWAYQLCQAFLVAYPPDEAPYLPHGGVTPDCILWDENDELLVTDFGVAQAFLAAAKRSADFRLERIAAYVPREVWGKPEEVTQQADIFAVGTILYQLATSNHPYGVDSPDPDLCRFRLMTELPVEATRWRTDLTPEFAQLLQQMVSSGLADRRKSFAEVARAIEQMAPAVVRPRPADVGGRASRPPAGETPAPRGEAPAELVRPARGEQVPGEPPPEDRARQTLRLPEADAAAEAERLKRAASLRQQEAQQRAETSEVRRRLDEEQRRIEELRDREREEALRREAEALAAARERAALRHDWLRRHVLHLLAAVILLVGGAFAFWILQTRARNDQIFSAAGQAWQSALRSVLAGGQNVSSLERLGIPKETLQSLSEILRRADQPPEQVTLLARGSGLTHQGGSVRITAGKELFVVPAQVESPGGLRARPTQDQIKELLENASDLQLTRERNALDRRLSEFQDAINECKLLSDLADRIHYDRGELQRALGWLYRFPDQKVIRLYRRALPDRPDQPANVEWRVLEPGTQGLLIANVAGQISYREGDRPIIEPITAAEPPKHREWCVRQTTDPLKEAFDKRDASIFARIAHADPEEVGRLFGWLRDCADPRLWFGALSEDATVPAEWRFEVRWTDSGPASPVSIPATLAFSPHDWTLTDAQGLILPDPPPVLRAVEFVRRTIPDLNALVRSTAPPPGETLGRGGPSFADIAQSLRQMDIAELQGIGVENPAFDHARAELRVSLKPLGADEWVPQTLTFDFSSGSDVPDYKGPPDHILWTQSAMPPGFRNAWEQLRDARWELAVMQRVLAALPPEISPAQQQQLEDWVAVVATLVPDFRAAPDADWFAGLPDRITRDLGSREPAVFRLVKVPSADARPALAYVMQRAVLQAEYRAHAAAAPLIIPSVEAFLTDHQPRPLIDDPAVTGVTYDEASSFAESLRCQLCSAAEWRALHHLSDKTGLDFDTGGVLEWCRSTAASTDDGSAAVIGHSWLETALNQFIASAPAPDETTKQPKSRPDPTIGFRLSIPLKLSPDILKPPR